MPFFYLHGSLFCDSPDLFLAMSIERPKRRFAGLQKKAEKYFFETLGAVTRRHPTRRLFRRHTRGFQRHTSNAYQSGFNKSQKPEDTLLATVRNYMQLSIRGEHTSSVGAPPLLRRDQPRVRHLQKQNDWISILVDILICDEFYKINSLQIFMDLRA